MCDVMLNVTSTLFALALGEREWKCKWNGRKRSTVDPRKSGNGPAPGTPRSSSDPFMISVSPLSQLGLTSRHRQPAPGEKCRVGLEKKKTPQQLSL